MEEERGLTFLDICKIILKRIWWVVGATALCTLIAVLVTQFWYNRNNRVYTVGYELVYPDNDSGKYPDNSLILASDFVSRSTVNAIKDGDEKFKNVDVDDMLNNDGISVTEQVTRDTVGVLKRSYTLTVKVKYFSSDKQAEAFIRSVANYPVTRINAIVANTEHGLYFSVYEGAGTYEDKINALVSQKSYLQSKYSSLSAYGNEVTVSGAALGNIFTKTQQDALLSQIEVNGYAVNPEEYKADAEVRKLELQQKIDDNTARIAALKEAEKDSGGQSGGSGAAVNSAAAFAAKTYADDDKLIISNVIQSLTDENSQMEIEIARIDRKLACIEKYTQEGTTENTAYKAFVARLDGYRDSLAAATEDLKAVNTNIYKDNTQVVFLNNKIKVDGGLNIIFAAILGLVLGFVVSAVVVCIVDAPKYKRAHYGAKSEGEQLSGDAPAEADGGAVESVDGAPEEK